MSLYDELGVSTGATNEEIKRAYRERSKETHPDHGGNPEQFKQVAVAYKVLADPDKRKRYDSGESVDKLRGTERTEDQEALEVLAMTLAATIDKVDIDRDDIIANMRERMRNAINGVSLEIGQAKSAQARWQNFLRRLKPGREDCPMTVLANANIRAAGQAVEGLEKKRRIGELAFESLGKYGYAFDQVDETSSVIQQYAQQYQSFANVFGGHR